MPIIIDGWNLIRNEMSFIDDLGNDSLDAAKQLIECLEFFLEDHPDPITLVFDSKYEYLGLKYENTPKLRIIPSKNADKYIKDFIDNVSDKQRPNLRVVSSDSEIYFYARDSRAVAIKAEKFWEKLKAACR